ncbi:unnamed protein product [Lactuca saligna]|uniref:Uncharacterized protein n=1 Tax=Lactuca saligna TaxID=75948 RepID=A0AA35VH83_LACSI|nr:unnamed protein product [Lactuca saligna]
MFQVSELILVELIDAKLVEEGDNGDAASGLGQISVMKLKYGLQFKILIWVDDLGQTIVMVLDREREGDGCGVSQSLSSLLMIKEETEVVRRRRGAEPLR